MLLPLLKPSLYAVDAGGQPVLLGGRCACGHTFFPMRLASCERCGLAADAVTPTALAGRGRLLATATVHAGPLRAAPFFVGAVALDDGPVIRTVLDEAAASIAVGHRVRAVLVAVTAEDRQALDLRFQREPERAAS